MQSYHSWHCMQLLHNMLHFHTAAAVCAPGLACWPRRGVVSWRASLAALWWSLLLMTRWGRVMQRAGRGSEPMGGYWLGRAAAEDWLGLDWATVLLLLVCTRERNIQRSAMAASDCMAPTDACAP